MKATERIIELPQGIQATIEGHRVAVSSGAKKNEREFHAEEITFEKKDGAMVLRSEKSSKRTNALLNSAEAHLRNMIEGLQKDYEYHLMVVFSHFPMTVAVKGNYVEIANFGGEKKPRKARIFGQTKVEIKGKEITVKGHNKEDTGQTAAAIENASHVRGGKDKRVFQDGIYVLNKTE